MSSFMIISTRCPKHLNTKKHTDAVSCAHEMFAAYPVFWKRQHDPSFTDRSNNGLTSDGQVSFHVRVAALNETGRDTGIVFAMKEKQQVELLSPSAPTHSSIGTFGRQLLFKEDVPLPS